MAWASRSSSRSRTTPTAAAAPTAPQIDVACSPRSKKTELPSSRVVAGHAEPDADLVADRRPRAPAGARRPPQRLGDRQRRRHDGGAGVEDRRQVRVVEVERVRERAVDAARRAAAGRRSDLPNRLAWGAPPQPLDHARDRVALAAAACSRGQRQPRACRASARTRCARSRSAAPGRARPAAKRASWTTSGVAHPLDEGERTHRRAGAADDLQRGQHEQERGRRARPPGAPG